MFKVSPMPLKNKSDAEANMSLFSLLTWNFHNEEIKYTIKKKLLSNEINESWEPMTWTFAG